MMSGKKGEKKTVQLISMPLDKLLFDPKNPRLPSNLHHSKEPEILRWMLQDATLIELIASIGSAGFFEAEPLLIVPIDDDSDEYIVIEGNRRLASVKLLQNPMLAPIKTKSVSQVAADSEHHPDHLPVVVYNDRNDILDYLGYRHITGIKEWSSLAKAKYMSQLYEAYFSQEGEDIFKKIAKLIGSRSDYVKKLLNGLWIFEEIREHGYFGIKSLDEDTIDFSLLTTAIGYKGLKEFIGIDHETLDDFTNKETLCDNLIQDTLCEFTTWMFKETDEGSTRLGESRNLKYLNKVVQNTEALSAFRGGQKIEKAAMLTSLPLENLTLYLNEAINSLELADETLKIIDNPSKKQSKLAKGIFRIAKQLNGAINAMLEKDEY